MVEVKALKKLLPENEIGAHQIDVLIVRRDILIQIPICESYDPVTRTN